MTTRRLFLNASKTNFIWFGISSSSWRSILLSSHKNSGTIFFGCTLPGCIAIDSPFLLSSAFATLVHHLSQLLNANFDNVVGPIRSSVNFQTLRGSSPLAPRQKNPPPLTPQTRNPRTATAVTTSATTISGRIGDSVSLRLICLHFWSKAQKLISICNFSRHRLRLRLTRHSRLSFYADPPCPTLNPPRTPPPYHQIPSSSPSRNQRLSGATT